MAPALDSAQPSCRPSGDAAAFIIGDVGPATERRLTARTAAGDRQSDDLQRPIRKFVQDIDGDKEHLLALRRGLDEAIQRGELVEAEGLMEDIEGAKAELASHRRCLGQLLHPASSEPEPKVLAGDVEADSDKRCKEAEDEANGDDKSTEAGESSSGEECRSFSGSWDEGGLTAGAAALIASAFSGAGIAGTGKLPARTLTLGGGSARSLRFAY